MGRLFELHGEIAGLQQSGGNDGKPEAEFVFEPVNVELLGPGDWEPDGSDSRKDFYGNGGDYAYGIKSQTLTYNFKTPYSMNPQGLTGKPCREFFARIPMHKPAASADWEFQFKHSTLTGNNIHVEVRVQDSGNIEIRTNNTLRNSLAGVIPVAPGDWPVLTIWIRIDNTAGFVRIYKDFNYDAGPILEWNGNTYRTFPAAQPVYSDFCHFFGQGRDAALDDVVFNDITMEVNVTAGAFLPGQTLTGSPSGATAIIESVDTVGPNQVLQLSTLSGWDGQQSSDPFLGDTSVSSSGTGVGNPVNGGLDPNSGLPENSYFAPAMVPDGQGNATNLSSNPVQTAANQWQNAVYDGVGGTTPLGLGDDSEVSYNFDTTGSAGFDLYTMTNHGVPALEIGAIYGVRVYSWCRKDGTGIDNTQVGLRSGTTNASGLTRPLGASFDVVSDAFLVDPNTSTAWTPATVDGIEAGQQFLP